MSKGASSPSQKVSSVCLTPACVLAASEILENLSPRYSEIDPCANFDNFVCDGWAEKHDLRADQGSSFTGTIMAENSQQILRHLLESPYPVEDQKVEIESLAKQKIFTKLQDGYRSCMDEEKLKAVGSAPLLNVLQKIEDHFPASRPHETSNSFPVPRNPDQKWMVSEGGNQLTETITYLTRVGVGALLNFHVQVCLPSGVSWIPSDAKIYRPTIKILMWSFHSSLRLVNQVCLPRSTIKTLKRLHGMVGR